jgi:hypothetical protein
MPLMASMSSALEGTLTGCMGFLDLDFLDVASPEQRFWNLNEPSGKENSQKCTANLSGWARESLRINFPGFVQAE